MSKHKLIDFDWLITSGGITQEDIKKRRELGWNFVTALPAKLIHPSATVGDTASIFSKYTPYPKEDSIGEIETSNVSDKPNDGIE